MTEKITRENASEHKKKKQGLNLTPGYALIGLRTTGPTCYSETSCSFACHFAILSRNVGILIGSLLRASCELKFQLAASWSSSVVVEVKAGCFRYCCNTLNTGTPVFMYETQLPISRNY